MNASFFLLAFVAIACGGAVDGVPSGGTTSPTSPPASSTEPTTPGPVNTTGNGPSSAPPKDCQLACDDGHEIQKGDLPCAPGYACYTRAACGNSIACTGPAGLCEEPDCLGYTQRVKACPAGATCETQRVCDVTLICEKSDAQCDGLPGCDEDDQEVANATECAKNGAACYSRSMCGARVFCVKNQ